MSINAITQEASLTKTTLPEKKEVKKENDVNFWSSDWTAGNFVRENIGWDGLADWLDDKDKICTDGKDDGQLSFSEKAESFGKGLAGIFKGAINHPIATAVTVGLGIGATILTGGAALPIMCAAGATIGTGMIGIGAYKASTAKTDAEAKMAWENIGNGTFALAGSALGAKAALGAAEKAGVISAQGAKDMNIAQATVQTFKTIPEAVKVSGMNIKGNVLTMTTGNVHAHSNALRGPEKFINKSKYNPNQSSKEVLSNNTEAFKILPEGTKVQTIEGVKTIGQGEVVVLDKAGNPYIQTTSSVLKRGTGFSEKALTDLSKNITLELTNKTDGFWNKVPAQYRKDAIEIMAKNRVKLAPKGFSDDYIVSQTKAEILEKMGAKFVYWDNDYQGSDEIVGFIYNGKTYSLENSSCQNSAINQAFEQMTSGKINLNEVISSSDLGKGRHFWTDENGNLNFMK